MPSFWRHVNQVLKESEIIIEVLDARMVDETRHRELERKIEASGKKILYVINKCDLVPNEALEEIKKKVTPSVFISSKERLGTTILKKKILQIAHGEHVTVGVVGYPNVGKSSLINALAGRHKARTSAESGFTKGMQKIRVDSRITILDTPGVFPSKENDTIKYGFTSAIDYGKIKDPEIVALKLIEAEKELIKNYFNLSQDDAEEMLEEIAFKFKKLQKGGKADLETAARFLLKEW
ncbi:MAG: GTPase, partial [Nanoarchaeota archaeon]|nr:GTPase [Nanoarchaeota archaeon]